jgi:tetratricopeptide (TPR) repeat protein
MKNVKSVMASACLAAVLVTASSLALSAAEPDPLEELTQSNPEFAKGRSAVEAKDWNGAIKALLAADKRTGNNADIHNHLGFAYRNSGDADTAIKHYHRALQINPRHRGAHEYIGEAYLMMKNPAKAEEHLAALKKVCPLLCDERDDLSRKIAAYKTSGR